MRRWEYFPWTYPKPNLVATKATHISGATVPLMIMACGKTTVAVSNPSQENIFNAAASFQVEIFGNNIYSLNFKPIFKIF